MMEGSLRLMHNVVFAVPFPLETTLRFLRALAGLLGVRLLGIFQELPKDPDDRRLLHDAVTVADGLDARQLGDAVELLRRRHGDVHRLLGILEPLQVPLAEVRARLGIPGPDPKTADLFRDKARMKDALRALGLPCARHRLVRSWDDAAGFAAEVGFPIVLKPPAGLGCKATWRVRSEDEMRQALGAAHPTVEEPTLAEEFLRGREFSFDTVTVGGQVRFSSISHYFPGPLDVMETPWIQWVVVVPRDQSGADHDEARRVGAAAIKGLGLESGFTHMEWFRRDDGSLAIGEIAARPPGANFVRLHGLACDADLYRAWARAVVDDAFDGPWSHRHATGCAYLRGPGRGRVARVDGVGRANHLVGGLVVESRLPSPGTPKSDSYEGDGYVIARAGDADSVRRALGTVIETIRIRYA